MLLNAFENTDARSEFQWDLHPKVKGVMYLLFKKKLNTNSDRYTKLIVMFLSLQIDCPTVFYLYPVLLPNKGCQHTKVKIPPWFMPTLTNTARGYIRGTRKFSSKKFVSFHFVRECILEQFRWEFRRFVERIVKEFVR